MEHWRRVHEPMKARSIVVGSLLQGQHYGSKAVAQFLVICAVQPSAVLSRPAHT